MRIVGGDWKGRPLAPVGKGDAAARLRPTSDRVRESLFNLLAHGDYPPFEDAIVLDLFAGTGALGLEALSRGAAHVTFVENGRPALALIERNVEGFGARDRTKILRRDATRIGPLIGAPATIVFADPPYRKGLGQTALTAALSGGWLAPGALVVLEEGEETGFPAGISLEDRRRYGDTHILIGTVSNEKSKGR